MLFYTHRSLVKKGFYDYDSTASLNLSEKATTMIVVLLVSERSLILFPSFFGYEMTLKSPLVLYWVKC